jgi:Uma2 family endonuclease
MSTVAAKTQYTPEDLLKMPDGDRFELVDGELVEKNMGWHSGWVGGRLHYFLSSYCAEKPIAVVAPADSGYQCFPDAPGMVCKPDVSVILLNRVPRLNELVGFCRVAPDAAAEVISPNDAYSEVEVKVDAYRTAGVKLVWVIDPPSRSVRVHRIDGTVTDLGENDELSGEDVLPGFRCPVAALFEIPPPAPSTS